MPKPKDRLTIRVDHDVVESLKKAGQRLPDPHQRDAALLHEGPVRIGGPSLSYTHNSDIFTHQGIAGIMRTNIEIDDRLVRQAMRCSGARTKKAVVETALQLLVRTYAQGSIARHRGKVQWEGDLN